MNICIPIETAPGAYQCGIANGRHMMVRSGGGLQNHTSGAYERPSEWYMA